MARTDRRRDTAFHEAGHAVATHFRPLSGRTLRVTIRRREASPKTAGTHFRRPSLPTSHGGGLSVDREALSHLLISVLGGHAADVILRGPDSWSGAAGDFRAASQLLLEADQWRLIDAASKEEGIPDLADIHDEELQRQVAARAVEDLFFLIEAAISEAVGLLQEKWHAVEAVARGLLRRGTLSGDEVAVLIERAEERRARKLQRGAPKWEAGVGDAPNPFD